MVPLGCWVTDDRGAYRLGCERVGFIQCTGPCSGFVWVMGLAIGMITCVERTVHSFDKVPPRPGVLGLLGCLN